MKIISTQTKIAQVQGLLGTEDLTLWEVGFVSELKKYPALSDKQLEALDRIWDKHFAG